MNVDQNEIEKFSAIASRWWDASGEFKPLHQINPLRLSYIADRCDGLFDKTVLDVGCGGGILAESMAKMGANVTGVDLSEDALEVAKLHALESQVTVNYEAISAEAIALRQPGSFDVVTCMEMIEHVPDPASVVKSCAQLVKPGGWVFYSTLNRNLKSYLMAIVAAEKLLNIVPNGTHDYDRFIKPSELLRWLDDTSLKPMGMTGLHFNPLTQQYLLSDRNVDVNYIVACQHLG